MPDGFLRPENNLLSLHGNEDITRSNISHGEDKVKLTPRDVVGIDQPGVHNARPSTIVGGSVIPRSVIIVL